MTRGADDGRNRGGTNALAARVRRLLTTFGECRAGVRSNGDAAWAPASLTSDYVDAESHRHALESVATDNVAPSLLGISPARNHTSTTRTDRQTNRGAAPYVLEKPRVDLLILLCCSCQYKRVGLHDCSVSAVSAIAFWNLDLPVRKQATKQQTRRGCLRKKAFASQLSKCLRSRVQAAPLIITLTCW